MWFEIVGLRSLVRDLWTSSVGNFGFGIFSSGSLAFGSLALRSSALESWLGIFGIFALGYLVRDLWCGTLVVGFSV